MSLKDLAKQTAVYGVSNVIVRLLNFLLVPYLTRIMSTEEYGVITDLYALIPFALVLLTMGMESGYFRFAGKARSEAEKREVFATTWGAVSIAAMLFMTVVLLFKPGISSTLGYSDHSSWIWITGAIITTEAFTALPFARLREQGKAFKYLIIKSLAVVVNVGLCFFLYGALPKLAANGIMTSIYDPGFGPGYYLVSNLVANIVVFFAILPSCDRILPKVNGPVFKKILLFSLPLLIGGIANTGNDFLDRQMIKYLLPEDIALAQLGIYGAAGKIASVMMIFTTIYRMGAEPFFLAEFKDGDFGRVNAEAMKYFIIVSVLIFLGITLFMDVFVLLVGVDFREGAHIVPMMVVSNILAGIVFNLSFWYKQIGATRFALYIAFTGLAFTIIFNILLVPVMGYTGAAVARLICESVMVVLSYILCRKHHPVPYDLKRIGEYVLAGAILYGAGILAGGLNVWLKYFLYLSFIAIFVCYAVWREKIDVKGMAKAVLRRNK